jgi:hypothetical protein
MGPHGYGEAYLAQPKQVALVVAGRHPAFQKESKINLSSSNRTRLARMHRDLKELSMANAQKPLRAGRFGASRIQFGPRSRRS